MTEINVISKNLWKLKINKAENLFKKKGTGQNNLLFI